MGGAEFGLPLGIAEGAPALGGYPVDAGHVGSGKEAFALDELREALGAGGVGDDGFAATVEVDDAEHLAAYRFVSGPEQEVGAPLLGFNDVRKGEEEGTGEVGVHDESIGTETGK